MKVSVMFLIPLSKGTFVFPIFRSTRWFLWLLSRTREWQLFQIFQYIFVQFCAYLRFKILIINVIFSSFDLFIVSINSNSNDRNIFTCWKQISLTPAMAEWHLSIWRRRNAAVSAETAFTINDTLGSWGSTSQVYGLFSESPSNTLPFKFASFEHSGGRIARLYSEMISCRAWWPESYIKTTHLKKIRTWYNIFYIIFGKRIRNWSLILKDTLIASLKYSLNSSSSGICGSMRIPAWNTFLQVWRRFRINLRWALISLGMNMSNPTVPEIYYLNFLPLLILASKD